VEVKKRTMKGRKELKKTFKEINNERKESKKQAIQG
jgi:hypothetical protein